MPFLILLKSPDPISLDLTLGVSLRMIMVYEAWKAQGGVGDRWAG